MPTGSWKDMKTFKVNEERPIILSTINYSSHSYKIDQCECLHLLEHF